MKEIRAIGLEDAATLPSILAMLCEEVRREEFTAALLDAAQRTGLGERVADVEDTMRAYLGTPREGCGDGVVLTRLSDVPPEPIA
jgi:hypothetical protein